MPKLARKEEGAGIVLVGSFNPAIFQPAWFASQKLISSEEADAARLEVIHAEVASFETHWFKLVVTNDRFSILTTQQSAYEHLRDLVVATFAVLRHTPLSSMGLNLEAHFECESTAEWHAIGDKLAPKPAWNSTFEGHVGLRSLRMQIEAVPEKHGRLLVTVEPSQKFQPGVFISVNDHYEKSTSDVEAGASVLVGVLDSSWTRSVEHARIAMESLQANL